MANERWYELRVRAGFETVVEQRLRKLNLEVLIPGQNPINPQEPNPLECRSTGYLHCRFALENRLSVAGIPGVLGILGAPESPPFEKELVSLQTATAFETEPCMEQTAACAPRGTTVLLFSERHMIHGYVFMSIECFCC
jgi:hypothetical protein